MLIRSSVNWRGCEVVKRILLTPSIRLTQSIRSANFNLVPYLSLALYAFTFWPNKLISLTPRATRSFISSNIPSGSLLTSSPRVYGTTQKLQNLLHPSIIETKAEGLISGVFGKTENFSTFGKLISTKDFLELRTSSYIFGKRCRVCGPKTMST